MTALDGTVAVLWGSVTKELTWIHLDPKQGRVSVASAKAGGFWVRDYGNLHNIDAIAAGAAEAWHDLQDGADLSSRATHRLAPPLMREIEPLPGLTAHQEGTP